MRTHVGKSARHAWPLHAVVCVLNELQQVGAGCGVWAKQ